MPARFPLELLSLLRCAEDGGRFVSADPGSAGGLVEGNVHCDACRQAHRISEGILSLLDEGRLDAEGANEMHVRDRSVAADGAREPKLLPVDEAEMAPTTAALEPLVGRVLLELGCGTGRYTLPLSRSCGAVLAVDFSRGSLRTLASRLPDDAPVALVHADVTRLALSAASFDRALATLVSNLPSGDHRRAMFTLVARALRPTGRFVFSTHHYGPRVRVKLEQIEGRYRDYPVYRRLFRPDDIRSEASAYFGRIGCRPIVVAPPFGRRFGIPLVSFSRWAERVPVLNKLASLLLFVAELS